MQLTEERLVTAVISSDKSAHDQSFALAGKSENWRELRRAAFRNPRRGQRGYDSRVLQDSPRLAIKNRPGSSKLLLLRESVLFPLRKQGNVGGGHPRLRADRRSGSRMLDSDAPSVNSPRVAPWVEIVAPRKRQQFQHGSADTPSASHERSALKLQGLLLGAETGANAGTNSGLCEGRWPEPHSAQCKSKQASSRARPAVEAMSIEAVPGGRVARNDRRGAEQLRSHGVGLEARVDHTDCSSTMLGNSRPRA